MTKYSKPTKYKGITFRSRLGADFAKWFDDLGIIWSHEPEGYKFLNSLSYMPSFFLPQQKAWFECKNVMLAEDKEKMLTLAKESELDVYVGNFIYDKEVLLQVVDAHNDNYAFYQGAILVAKCLKCGKVWIMPEWGDWTCRVCGTYEGNGHFDILETVTTMNFDLSSGWGA